MWLGFFACFSSLLLLLRDIVLLFLWLFLNSSKVLFQTDFKDWIMHIRVARSVSPNIFPPVFGRNFPFTPILPGSLFLSHLQFPFHSSVSFPPSVVSLLLFWAWFVCFLTKWNKSVILWPHIGKLCKVFFFPIFLSSAACRILGHFLPSFGKVFSSNNFC